MTACCQLGLNLQVLTAQILWLHLARPPSTDSAHTMTSRSFQTLRRRAAQCLRGLGLLTSLALVVLVLGLLFPREVAALEGDAPPPPARVGQLSLIFSNVRMRVDRVSAWEQAVLNTPITTNAALATGIPGRTEVHVGGTALRLGQESQVVWTEVNDTRLHIEMIDGLFALRVRVLAPGERVLLTAGGVTVQVLQPGSYRFRHVAQRARLRVWVLEGQARVSFNQQDISLGPQQQVQVDAAVASELAASASEDHASFHEFANGRDKRSEISLSLQHVVAEMTGAEALDGQGNWRDEAGYGAVWFPHTLPTDWAPYRFGRWRWIAPWGWTWIDDAPWGFAPSHYGRWLFTGGRWGWVPGQTAAANAAQRPVYAPALVGFYGNSTGAAWTAAGASTPVVGWYPLAPGEVYWPAYSTQLPYVRALNAANVSDMSQIQALPAANAKGPAHRFSRTAFAASAMPFAAFSRMQDVASNATLLSPAALAQAPLSGRGLPPPAPPPTQAPAPTRTR
jgi:hypothetical protein